MNEAWSVSESSCVHVWVHVCVGVISQVIQVRFAQRVTGNLWAALFTQNMQRHWLTKHLEQKTQPEDELQM